MRAQLRIVAGAFKGRKLNCNISEDLRPTPQMVREALFSILGNAIPGRHFYDVFAGTGINGLEALSRGASLVVFIERDFRLGNEIEQHARAFGASKQCRVLRADAYRWADTWKAPGEPVNLFLSPPFSDYERRLDDLLVLVNDLQRKCTDDSVLVLQSERGSGLEKLPFLEQWDRRRYGRNMLSIWVKEAAAASVPETEAEPSVEGPEEISES
jgi:16S rRNA (guanine966-N2)-methyltransferase